MSLPAHWIVNPTLGNGLSTPPIVAPTGAPIRVMPFADAPGQYSQRPLWLCRHQQSGVNRFGEKAMEQPYAVLRWAAWQECPWDLHLVRWFATVEDAMQATGVVTQEGSTRK